MSAVESRLALSTAHFGRHGVVTPARARQFDAELRGAFALAADAGMTLIDTSADHAEAEALVGRLAPRERPFRTIAKTAPVGAGLAAVEARAQKSLRNLGVPRAHALVVSEAEDLLGPDGDALWRALLGLRDAGLFEKIGVAARLEDAPAALARRYKPDIMQLPVSLLDQRLVIGGELQTLAELGGDHDTPLVWIAFFAVLGLLLAMEGYSGAFRQKDLLDHPPPADMGGQEDDDGPKTCIVCWERHPILTLCPCAHTLCALCSLRVSKCPLCRANIVGRSVTIGTQRPRRLVFAAGGQAPAMLA